VVIVLLVAVAVGAARYVLERIQTKDALLAERQAELFKEKELVSQLLPLADLVINEERKKRREAEQHRKEAEAALQELGKTLDAERQAWKDEEKRRRRAEESLVYHYERSLPNELAQATKMHVPSLVAAAHLSVALAGDRETSKDTAGQLRSQAIEQLRAAIRLDPNNSDGWAWREVLARQLILSLAAMDDAVARDALRGEARKLLIAARFAAPDERRPEFERLLREISEP
jgi:hypothetical protein